MDHGHGRAQDASHGNRHSAGGRNKHHQLRLLAWEVTRSCPLNCRHCRGAAEHRQYEGELSTDECRRVLESLPALGSPIVILTGGEPMARPDIYKIARLGSDLDLRMVMAPCGTLMDEDSTRRIIDSGIMRISLSIDGADAQPHDGFRQVDGAFDSVRNAARLARNAGLEFQINTTVTSLNVDQLADIHLLAVEMGAVGFHPFLLVPTGRGGQIADLAINPERYEEVLNWLYETSLESPIQFKPTCAPHYYRVLRQREKKAGRTVSVDTHGMNAMTKGCLGGQSFAFLSHVGKAQICGFMDVEGGDIREAEYDFGAIWTGSELYKTVRDLSLYEGKCGVCEYIRFCGGCRARALAETGNYMAEEPSCVYTPRKAAAQ